MQNQEQRRNEYIKSGACFDLFDLEKLDIKGQLAVGRDARHATRAISKICRDGQTTFTANGHAGNTNVPPLDNLILTDFEGEGFTLFVGYLYDLA